MRTEIATLGEFGLIDRLTKGIKLENESSKYGVGDDAAVLLSFLSGCLPTGAVVIVRNRRDNESVLGKVIGLMSRGMVFTDRDSAVIVTRPDLPKQFFKVDL